MPPTNTVNESEWRLAMPDGVSFHTHRMALHSDIGTKSGRERLDRDLDLAFDMLKPAAPDVIAYACTAGSMVNPVGALPDALRARHGIEAVTTSAAVIAALKALGAVKLSVATPYGQALNRHEMTFLEANGFRIQRIAGLGIGESGPSEYPRIARTTLEDVRAHAIATFVPGSDALVLLCTDFPTQALITDLEAHLGVAVVTSNQATLWACLRAAGITDAPRDHGRLAEIQA
ncbi:MAG: hypothetical protein JJ902_06740 [Roseibium sp.]|nr:hypothetical protein [Roseibium sp.]